MKINGIPHTNNAVVKNIGPHGGFTINTSELIPYLTRQEKEQLIAELQENIARVYK